MADKKTRSKRYSEEFKLQAAKIIVEGGYTDHQTAGQLGVSDWALRCEIACDPWAPSPTTQPSNEPSSDNF